MEHMRCLPLNIGKSQMTAVSLESLHETTEENHRYSLLSTISSLTGKLAVIFTQRPPARK